MTRRAVLFAALVPVGAVPAAAVSHGDGHHRTVVGGHQVRFDGLGPEKWAARWRREKRVNVKLRRLLSARLVKVVYLVDAFRCIHGYEGSWSANTGNGYYGGLQFGSSEWRTYGAVFAPRADKATPAEQITAGIAYHAVSGFRPWPQTARTCGLLP